MQNYYNWKSKLFALPIFLLSFTHVMVCKVKIILGGQTFEMEILMDLHVLRSPDSENHIFSKWSLCMCVCVCLCVCVSVINLTQKQIIAESSNLAFYIWVIGRCYLKLFIKIGQKFCAHKRILIN